MTVAAVSSRRVNIAQQNHQMWFGGSTEGIQIGPSGGRRARGGRESEKQGSQRLVSVTVGRNGYIPMGQVLEHEVGPQRRLKVVEGAGHAAGCFFEVSHQTGKRETPPGLKPRSTARCTVPVAVTVRRHVRVQMRPESGNLPVAEGGGRTEGQGEEERTRLD